MEILLLVLAVGCLALVWVVSVLQRKVMETRDAVKIINRLCVKEGMRVQYACWIFDELVGETDENKRNAIAVNALNKMATLSYDELVKVLKAKSAP